MAEIPKRLAPDGKADVSSTESLADLNAFVTQRNANKLPGEPHDELFTESDLTKLAFWMATGSGKTLILHLNYHQFLHYNKELLDNILLITPNEGLSEQHLEELAAPGIPARRFDLNHSGLWSGDRNVVQVIEITKLVEEKRSGGVSVPVEAFEGRNLIFVDEGHKGSGGEAWRKYRDALGATGFAFEYSATFGQALSAARNDLLTAGYGKAIVFDYSYRYFYEDGYGKDFCIINLCDETDAEKTDLLLLSNLLAFYEQLRLFQEQADALRSYNLEKPLWVFVGSTVNAVYSENKQKRSDVLTVARFLHRVLSDRNWATKCLANLLKGDSGLTTSDDIDLFAGRFPYLHDLGLSAPALYDDILRRFFRAPAGGGLHLCDIKSASGELGLKAAGATEYFGLIYIGDTAEFKKLVEADDSGIVLEEDVITASLFTGINRPETPIHILIGAKKFMEGWNSWRVSSMGLLNIGRQPLSRGKGVGFFEESGFYPDFIVWVVEECKQRIVFAEPHGMLYAEAYIHDEKARLHERLPELAREIGKRSGHSDISLDAFIISATSYEELRKRYDDGTWDQSKFAEKHILFRKHRADYDYIGLLLTGS